MPRSAFLQPLSGQIGSDSSGYRPAGRDTAQRFFRADLHVHSRYSGAGHLQGTGLRSGIGDPEVIYRAAKARGMDLVTFTDLDTIDGCLAFLECHPEADDFIISEEIVALDPRAGGRIHVLLFDIAEAQHADAQMLKGDVRDLMGWARREGIVASLSSALRGLAADAWMGEAMRDILPLFDRFEVKNGALGRTHNRLAARLARQAVSGGRPGMTAGSNAHGPARVGSTVTVSAARTPREFVDDLRARRTWTSGEDGSLWAASTDLSRLLAGEYRALVGSGIGPGGGRRLTRVLSRAPLHLLGTPYLGHGLRRARASVRARAAWRVLDRIEREEFQARSERYLPSALTGGAKRKTTTKRPSIAASAGTKCP